MTTEKRNAGNKSEVRSEDSKIFIEGYAALYNVRSSPDLGFIEVIEKGAFDGADLSDVRMLFNHDTSKLLARTKSGTLTVTADDKGLHYRGEVADTSYGRDLVELLKRGDVDQSSFAFRIPKGGDDWQLQDDGSMVRHIRKIQLVNDVSPCPYPAYEQTSAAKRSLEEYQETVKHNQDEYRRIAALVLTLGMLNQLHN